MDTQNPTFRRTRKVNGTRTEPHTVNGVTRLVEVPYTTHVTVPPRDWDHIVRGGVTAATAVTVAGSIAWSTASIGDLLARTVHPAIAYGAAAVFDAAWISCMALEWLARYDRRKAELPRRAGHVALVIAMAAVATHGILQAGHGAIVIGIIGALVSALAKGLWTLTMRHFSVELDDRSQQWVEQRLSEVHAQLATAAVDRELARVEGMTADYRAAYSIERADREPAASEAPAIERADTPVQDQVDTAITVTRTVLGLDVAPADVAAQLVRSRIVPDPADALRLAAERMVRDGAQHGAPQVSGLSKAAAITEIAEWCGGAAPSDLIVRLLSHHKVAVSDAQVRNELSRWRSRQAKTAPKSGFGFTGGAK